LGNSIKGERWYEKKKWYSSYELGSRSVPIQTLIALAKLHKTSVDYLLGLADNPKPYQ